MDTFDLDEILVKARTLDPVAMTRLCEYYYPKILKFMYYRVDSSKAEDLTGEVFLKVMRSISSQHGRFEPWLYKIARNVIIDKARYANARPEVSMPEELEGHIPDGSNVIGDVDSVLDIQYALSKVNGEQRELLTLKFIQGLTNEEIGEITGKSQGALRAMQFRALSALRDKIRKEGGRQ